MFKQKLKRAWFHLGDLAVSAFFSSGEFQRATWGDLSITEPRGGPTVRGLVFGNAAAVWNERLVTATRLIPAENPVILDVGANIGMYTMIFAKLKGARVFSFEPGARAFAALKQNVANNHLSNVSTINAGISDKEETIFIAPPRERLALEPGNTCVWTIYGDNSAGIGSAAHFTSIDLFARSENIDRLDYIKIDVEGHEVPVLRGAMETVARLRPVIQLEYHPVTWKRANIDTSEFIAWVTKSDYFPVISVGRKYSALDSLDPSASIWSSPVDFFLIPRERQDMSDILNAQS